MDWKGIKAAGLAEADNCQLGVQSNQYVPSEDRGGKVSVPDISQN